MTLTRGCNCGAGRFEVTGEDPGVRPQVRIFTDYAAPWEAIPDDGLPRLPEGLS